MKYTEAESTKSEGKLHLGSAFFLTAGFSTSEIAHKKQNVAKAAQQITMKKTTVEKPTDIDETILSRFRNSKKQGLKDLEESGAEAGICFVNKHAEFLELCRLEHWCNKTHGNQRLYLEGLGLSGLADILAGGEGQGEDLVSVLEELGGEDANEGEWLEAFVEAAVKQFGQIKPQI